MDSELVRQRLEDGLAAGEPTYNDFFLLRFFGLEVSYGDETCTVRIPTADYMGNMQKSLHGGVIAMGADISMGHLCHHVDMQSVTLEMDLKFLRAINGPVRCEARFLHKGRRVVHLESRVIDEESDRLSAIATGTWFRVNPDG